MIALVLSSLSALYQTCPVNRELFTSLLFYNEKEYKNQPMVRQELLDKTAVQ